MPVWNSNNYFEQSYKAGIYLTEAIILIGVIFKS